MLFKSKLIIKIMIENLLHYIWKTRNFDVINVKTTDNQSVKIFNSGLWNRDAGPDFKQAIIEIGGVTWAGDVEIHVRSSDWYRHNHDKDEKYNSVILHVVYEHDKDVLLKGSESIPTLELKKYIAEETFNSYKRLADSDMRIPCKFGVKDIPKEKFEEIMLATSIERLDRKSQAVFEELRGCGYDWEEVSFRRMARNFGFRTNSTAFELLAKSVEYKQIAKHTTSKLQVYAIIFGQAGLLDDEIEGDTYYEALQYEYNYLKYKYKWIAIDKKIWNKLRLRPANFHCIRLAQFCELLLVPNLIQNIFDDKFSIEDLIPQELEPHEYWKKHYEFAKESKSHKNNIGETAVNLLYINTIIPIKYSFGIYVGKPAVTERAVLFQRGLQFEANHITRKYKEAGFLCRSAADSQAIMEISEKYCVSRKCACCPIGQQIIKKPPV